MKKFSIVMLALVLALVFSSNVLADDKEECVALCDAAAKMMVENLDGALAEINKADGQFVKGDIYVFAMEGTVMKAHPIKPALIGKDLAETKDSNGKAFFQDFVAVAKDPGSGWVDYMWPKPGEDTPSEKTSYILKVEGTDYLVGAGVYK